MKFAVFPIDEACGAILAHSIGTPAGVLKKGRRLSAADVETLRAAGVATVMAARLSETDVGEDAAAARIAQVLASTTVTAAAPFTGRANLFAGAAGIARFDTDAIHALNLIDEGITIATVRDGERVEAGQMIATVKIIPFAVAAGALDQAAVQAAIAKLTVAAFSPHRAGLVLTRLPATKASVLAKRERVIRDRLESCGSTLGETVVVAHDADAVAAELKRMALAGHSPLLVFAASAIVDREDVTGRAIVAAGGRIERLGMPVDPGNLMLIGALGTTPVVGIPSCAASPALNGFDWVLERLLAGQPPTSRDIARMGVGGLLKEIASRPQPRTGVIVEAEARRASRIACVILAGGRSTRMGSNKLLELVGGKPIVRHVAEAALASSAAPVVVVTGHQVDDVRAALAGLDLVFAHNAEFAVGISTSVKVGIAALPPRVDGAMITLGDMPELTGEQIDRLISAFAPKEGRGIVVPVRHGRRGNPVLWSSAYFDEMRTLAGDAGAKHLLGLHADAVVEVDLASDAVLTDIDTPDALAALRQRTIPQR